MTMQSIYAKLQVLGKRPGTCSKLLRACVSLARAPNGTDRRQICSIPVSDPYRMVNGSNDGKQQISTCIHVELPLAK